MGLRLIAGTAVALLLGGCTNDVVYDDRELEVDEQVVDDELALETMSEHAACEAQANAYQRQGLDIGCPTTIYRCPEYMRAPHGASCLLYEAASVDDCVARYRAATSCDELYRADGCMAVAVADSAPLGCDDQLQ